MFTLLKPIFLLADSQLLFWRENGQLLLERVPRTRERMKAPYVGASNGDNPDFYAIFVSAMEGAGLFECRMIPSIVSEADLLFLNDADIILLAGGDVELGWRVFLKNGLNNHLVRRYFEGTSLIGLSAGAVQLACAVLPPMDDLSKPLNWFLSLLAPMKNPIIGKLQQGSCGSRQLRLGQSVYRQVVVLFITRIIQSNLYVTLWWNCR